MRRTRGTSKTRRTRSKMRMTKNTKNDQNNSVFLSPPPKKRPFSFLGPSFIVLGRFGNVWRVLGSCRRLRCIDSPPPLSPLPPPHTYPQGCVLYSTIFLFSNGGRRRGVFGGLRTTHPCPPRAPPHNLFSLSLSLRERELYIFIYNTDNEQTNNPHLSKKNFRTIPASPPSLTHPIPLLLYPPKNKNPKNQKKALLFLLQDPSGKRGSGRAKERRGADGNATFRGSIPERKANVREGRGRESIPTIIMPEYLFHEG